VALFDRFIAAARAMGTVQVVPQFLVCPVSVELKLRLPGYHMLGCTA
jgi:hypothetical protein